MQRIKKGDQVIVIAGKERGRRGSVTAIRGDGRLVIEGVNLAKKHVRPDPNEGIQGGIVDHEMPLHASNVMLYNPQTEKGDRVGARLLEDSSGGKRKVRYFKSTGEVVDA